MAFAPAKNGRASESDATKLQAYIKALFASMTGGIPWLVRLFLDPPWTFEPGRIACGRTPITLEIDAQARVRFNARLCTDASVIGAAMTNDVCSIFRFGETTAMPLADFFAASFDQRDMSQLQLQLAWDIARTLELRLGKGGVTLAPDMVPSTITLTDFTTECGAVTVREQTLVNRWLAGQECGARHKNLPWSCTFDGTRVGGHSVSTMCIVYPSNYACWAPLQDRGGKRSLIV